VVGALRAEPDGGTDGDVDLVPDLGIIECRQPAEPPQTDARFAFLAGEKNHCFLPESQWKTFHFLDSLDKNHHSLHLLRNYGHLDVFMGKDAHRDVFPLILNELER